MIRRFLIVLATILISSFILFFSIIQTAQVKYSFNGISGDAHQRILGDNVVIDYYFPYPGRILPDHPLWSLKAFRDRLWLVLTPKAERRAELNLLFANKRVVSSKILFQLDKPELAYSTLVKAERYLETAWKEEETARLKGVDTKNFLQSLSLASLKHRQVINEILDIAPEDAKPQIIKIEDKVKIIFQETKPLLLQEGVEAPKNPFDGD
jgi:hypothetical protein